MLVPRHMWHADSSREVQLTLWRSFGGVLIHIHHFHHFGMLATGLTTLEVGNCTWFKAKIKSVDSFCISSANVRFGWNVIVICLMAPNVQLRLRTKQHFLMVIFRIVTEKSWIGVHYHLCERIREMQHRVSSYSWWHPCSWCMCVCTCVCACMLERQRGRENREKNPSVTVS